MKKVILTLIAAAIAAAQASTPEIVSRMIPVRYVSTNHLQNLLSVPGLSIKADEGMHVLVVTGRADAVSTIEEMVKKLDVAPPEKSNIELTVYMIAGGADASRGHDMPADLASTVKQLQQLFPYKNYRLLDSLVIRGRDGERADNSGLLADPGSRAPLNYAFGYNSAIVQHGPPRSVRLNGLVMRLFVFRQISEKVSTQDQGTIHTDIDIREGQKVVVGKSTFGADDAFILVVTAKVIE